MSHVMKLILDYINIYKSNPHSLKMEKEYISFFLSKHWPNNFDPGHPGLNDLFSCAAAEIDFHIRGEDEKFDFRPIKRLGKILCLAFEQEEFRKRFERNFTLQENLANYLKHEGQNTLNYQEMGLEFIKKLRDLPLERQKELRDICVSLSKGFRDYWNNQHPYGFKKYAA